MGYRDQVKRGGLDSSPGFLIKSPESPHRTTMPSWDKGETQFRVFPAACEGGWKPMRESLDDDDFGVAVWAERVAKRLGVREQLTYNTRVPGAQSNPTERFVPALHALIKEKPKEVPDDWIGWIQGGSGRGAKLPDKIKSCLYLQGAEVMRQGKMLVNAAGQPAPLFPAMLMASVSVQMNFEKLANTRVTELINNVPTITYDAATALAQVKGNDDNARAQKDAIYAYAFCTGDWCSINGGRVLRIFQAPPQLNVQPHYAVVPGDVMDLSSIADKVHGLWWPWDKLLRYHTAEEQIQLLCRAFPAEAVDYVFGNSEYSACLPAQVRGAWGRYRSGQSATAPGVQFGASGPAAAAQAPAPAAAAPAPAAAAPAPAAAAPAPAAAAPAPAAAAPAAPPAVASVAPGGVDLSGGGGVVASAANNPAGAPIMTGSGFGQQPAEFSQPLAAAPPAAPMPSAAAPVQPGTPTGATAGGDVDPDRLAAAMADLEAGRAQAAQAAQGVPGQPPKDDETPF